MELEEAMKRYGIPVPEDIFNYDETKYREFHEMYLKSFYSTFCSSKPKEKNDKNKIHVAVVLGGQIGAGKGSLVAETKRTFKSEGNEDIILIDDDQYRQFYPNREEILKQCPEHYTKITATATSKITPKIMKFATDNKYDFIFDGTMKNIRIVNTMETWSDYQIQVKVMATSRLRSILWMAIRNAKLRSNNDGRFATIEIHDETYFGIPKTLEHLERMGLAYEIKLYTRGSEPFFPIEQYSSLRENNISSATRLEELREQDEVQFLNEAPDLIRYLKDVVANLSEDEKKEAYKIIEMIEGEIISRGSGCESR